MNIELRASLKEERYYDTKPTFLSVDVTINGREYHMYKPIPENAEPFVFDYLWEDFGKQIKEEYLKNLALDNSTKT